MLQPAHGVPPGSGQRRAPRSVMQRWPRGRGQPFCKICVPSARILIPWPRLVSYQFYPDAFAQHCREP
eukprot:3954907-Lingulodinium_polyedra.AAC.1